MWLINTETLKLEEFVNAKETPYAILSHRWGSAEVRFEEMQSGGGREKIAFEKIILTCRLAQQDSLQYAWVDTCCIDKRSSAELSEAINSMYAWYANARVCYAFLADVDANVALDPDAPGNLASSAWFTRSWTLQELIAPKKVVFYGFSWRCLGTRADLAQQLENITRIDKDILRGNFSLVSKASIAQKMSWASQRRASREEDIAYSLFGLFDVNLPLLYGEGKKAFRRLQEEIMRHGTDQSILAWTQRHTEQQGLLAESPDGFSESYNIYQGLSSLYIPLGSDVFAYGSALNLGQLGVQVKLPVSPWIPNVYIAWLACHSREKRASSAKSNTQAVGIFIYGRPYSGHRSFWRTSVEGPHLLVVPEHRLEKLIQHKLYFVLSTGIATEPCPPSGIWDCVLDRKMVIHHDIRQSPEVDDCVTVEVSPSQSILTINPGCVGIVASFTVCNRNDSKIACSVVLGMDLHSQLICLISHGGQRCSHLQRWFLAWLAEDDEGKSSELRYSSSNNEHFLGLEPFQPNVWTWRLQESGSQSVYPILSDPYNQCLTKNRSKWLWSGLFIHCYHVDDGKDLVRHFHVEVVSKNETRAWTKNKLSCLEPDQKSRKVPELVHYRSWWANR